MPNTVPPADAAQLRILDSLRLRLSAVNNALAQTRAQVESGDPLPPWPALQQSLHLSSSALVDLAATLSTHHAVLASIHAYPMPTYPSTGADGPPVAENVRQQLMRKKLEPPAQDLIESGSKFMDQRREQDNGAALDDVDDMRELWDWAADLVPSIIMKQAWNADYTNQELDQGYKTVRTGLKRRLNRDRAEADDEEDESSEDDDDQDEYDDDRQANSESMQADGTAGTVEKQGRRSRAPPALSVEDTLRFMHRGARSNSNSLR